jgi:uncharacterized protein (TIGR00255 family)
MSIFSMTGFARAASSFGPARFAWELKTVNAKGLDVRLRLPQGFEAIDLTVQKRLGEKLKRGTCYATLSVQRETTAPEIRINKDILLRLIAALADIPLGSMQPASLDGLLGLRGVVEVAEAVEDPVQTELLQAHVLATLNESLEALVAMRLGEGTALAKMLLARLDKIGALTDAADTCPGRQPEAIQARLAQTIAALSTQPNLDPNRLHQEALIMAAKADVREELDRLKTHVAAVRERLVSGGEVGRRLDFLAQELGREANTLCAKSNDAELTRLGLELRVEIEQFREQVQNLE